MRELDLFVDTLAESVGRQVAEAVAAELANRREVGLLPLADACAYLGGLSESNLRSLVKSGEVPSVRIGGRLLFDPVRLREWWREHEQGGEA